MKKNKLFTKLFLSCLALSTGLLLGDHAFANSAETADPEKIITESSQKLLQLKATKQRFSEQKNENIKQLSSIEKNIQKIQIDLNQLEKIESTGTVSEILDHKSDQTVVLTATPLPTIAAKKDPIDTKKERLTELKQKQTSVKLNTETLLQQESELTSQELQVSKEIEHAKKMQVEQTKQTDTRSAVVTAAKTQLGKPYVYGAAGPDAFDCSGLVQVAFAAAGHNVGRTTVDQETAGATISVSQAQAGDLVFWGSHGGTHHVGISIGNGSYIHAPVPGDVVQIATVASYTPDFAVKVL